MTNILRSSFCRLSWWSVDLHSAMRRLLFIVFVLLLSANYLLTSSVAHASPPHPIPFYRQATPPTQVLSAAQTDTSIIGGEAAAEGAWPWMVAIIEAHGDSAYWSQFCAGTLISPEWVLTAAHCTYYVSGEAVEPSSLAIVAGRQQLSMDDGEQIGIEKIVRHPLYDAALADYDVALLKLVRPSTQPVVRMATPEDLALESADTTALVIGWGRTEDKARVDNLQQVDVPLVSADVCRKAYHVFGYTITDRMICAGLSEGGRDACSGDSGGPLVVQLSSPDDAEAAEWVEVGIVSWGRGCALPDSYGVYTRISEVYDWVEQQTDLGDIIPPPEGTVVLPQPNRPGKDEVDAPKGQDGYLLFLPVVTR